MNIEKQKNIKNYDHLHDHGHDDHNHEHLESDSSLIRHELMCHLPYAIFSVALGIIFLSIFTMFSYSLDPKLIKKGYRLLFHSFHFLHLVFATTGTILTFLRYSSNYRRALIVGILSPIVFCMLSDVFLPYIGGYILGQQMHLHICFFNEWANVVPFLVFGVINGFVLSHNYSGFMKYFSYGSHFVHILISSLASLFYMVSHGFMSWNHQMGMVFVVMIIAVVLPCTFSDVVIPMYFARKSK